MSTVIYHNPERDTSRNPLAMIRQSGEEPEAIEYLQHQQRRARLIELMQALAMTPRQLLRRKSAPYDELRLDDPKWTDEHLVDVLMAHPIFINRPVVATPNGSRLSRPSEGVLDILPNPRTWPFTEVDSQVVIDEKGKRRV